ncbi:hypothetical protein [Vineibacter terrae]|uniref:hypothetical protein n=1 Tax=Vineibacter terrae TaxID=2586908 RepID=UPI002E2FE804|nr:hypothetical protein [Vineibacter terrae]HEX2886798.1 hypothetical protein [Vineibacter terrae]
MTDATYQANAVRLRARLPNGQVLIEHLRRIGAGGGIEPTGIYRAVWPFHIEIPGQDIHALKALASALPLATFARDPDEVDAFGNLVPRRPPQAATDAPAAPATGQQEPALRGFLAAHFSTKGEDA